MPNGAELARAIGIAESRAALVVAFLLVVVGSALCLSAIRKRPPMIHAVKLRQEDVRVASTSSTVTGTLVVYLTPHGLARIDEARTRYGAEAVIVSLEVPSDEFFPSTPES